jgi:hypothetical protein
VKAEPIYDKRGRQVYVGDVLKVYHFRERNGTTHYMYKVVAERDGWLMGMSIHDIPKKWQDAHSFRLDLIEESSFEIVEGYGPKPCVDFRDRPKCKTTAAPSGE